VHGTSQTANCFWLEAAFAHLLFFFSFCFPEWGETSPLDMLATVFPVVNDDDDDYKCGTVDRMIGRGNGRTQRKPAPNATLSTTNPIWHDLITFLYAMTICAYSWYVTSDAISNFGAGNLNLKQKELASSLVNHPLWVYPGAQSTCWLEVL
jgi:hypothetical protein